MPRQKGSPLTVHIYRRLPFKGQLATFPLFLLIDTKQWKTFNAYVERIYKKQIPDKLSSCVDTIRVASEDFERKYKERASKLRRTRTGTDTVTLRKAFTVSFSQYGREEIQKISKRHLAFSPVLSISVKEAPPNFKYGQYQRPSIYVSKVEFGFEPPSVTGAFLQMRPPGKDWFVPLGGLKKYWSERLKELKIFKINPRAVKPRRIFFRTMEETYGMMPMDADALRKRRKSKELGKQFEEFFKSLEKYLNYKFYDKIKKQYSAWEQRYAANRL